MTEVETTERGSAEAQPRIAYFIDQQPEVTDFESAVISGLSATPKEIPAKFFYDEEGSHIFNRICETPEYYVTRTEIGLLGDCGPEIADLAGPGVVIIEYGCGSALKIRRLLEALDRPAEYAGIDISPEHLRFVVEDIAREYPDLRVGGICADFTGDFALPPDVAEDGGRKLGFFPGSTIGNQTPEEAEGFLKMIRAQVGDDGALLIGVDLKKDIDVLNRAYNDAAGETAAFNLNLLHRIDRELKSEIDIGGFEHDAFYNEGAGRIEMHLRSLRDQSIVIDGQEFSFANGETIHTENSYKYTLKEFAELAARAGFKVAKTWTDKDNLFSVQYLSAV